MIGARPGKVEPRRETRGWLVGVRFSDVLRRPVAWIIIGLVLFLVGAQLPYEEICPPPFARRCLARTYIDLTPTRASDGWSMWFWYARLGALLVALFLILRGGSHSRRAAGFVVFFSLMAIGGYLSTAMLHVVFGAWEPGAALWPLGALIMLAAALRVRGPEQVQPAVSAAHVRKPLVVMVSAAALIGVAAALEEDLAGYLFAFGAVVFVAGALTLRGRAERKGHGWRRLLALPLALAGVFVAVTYFVPWVEREYDYLLIRTAYMFDVRRDDFWEIFSLLGFVAGPVAAALDVAARARVRPLFVGGVLFTAYWLSDTVIITLTGAWPDYSPEWGLGVFLALVAVVLMWTTVFFLAMNEQQA